MDYRNFRVNDMVPTETVTLRLISCVRKGELVHSGSTREDRSSVLVL